MLPQGILFDLDDTIIAFESVAENVWNVVCKSYFAECGLSTSDELINTIHEARIQFWSDKERNKKARQNLREARRGVVKLALDIIGITDYSLANRIADTYSSQRDEYIQFLPGAKETLETLKNDGISLALITNGEAEYQRYKIRRFNLEEYFDVVLIEGEIGYGKPDKKIFLNAMEALKLDSDALWAVGDNLEWDVWGPQQVGIYSIWNDYAKKGLPKSSPIVPDRIINSIAEIIGI